MGIVNQLGVPTRGQSCDWHVTLKQNNAPHEDGDEGDEVAHVSADTLQCSRLLLSEVRDTPSLGDPMKPTLP